jgi:RNA-splicing ligase RtcB
MVLEANSHNVRTVKDLIEVLSKVYGVDKKSRDCQAMQLEKESVRQYHARLKEYLVASGMIQNTDNFNNWMLKSFMEGVKAEIKVKLQAVLPYDIEEAFRKAQTAEVWLLSQKVKKAETKTLTSIEAEVNNSGKIIGNINNNNNISRFSKSHIFID